MQTASERRNTIIQLLNDGRTIATSELSELLQTTPVTVRRDLDKLERDGMVQRSWGKVCLRADRRFTPLSAAPFTEREKWYYEEKKLIAKAAATFIEENDSVILDSGTTVCLLAEMIRGMNSLSVVTNFLPLYNVFSNSSVSVQFSGGFFEKEHLAVVGPDCESFFRSMSVGKAFLGATSMRYPGGFSVCSPFQCGVKRQMVASAKEIYMLMDSSKVNASGINTFADLDQIDYLITVSTAFTEEHEQALHNAGVKVIYADQM